MRGDKADKARWNCVNKDTPPGDTAARLIHKSVLFIKEDEERRGFLILCVRAYFAPIVCSFHKGFPANIHYSLSQPPPLSLSRNQQVFDTDI